MTRLVFVTPVFGRPEITGVCLRQRAQLIGELRPRGVDAACVVVGDDENLETADALGFVALEQENVLGRKVNDGFELACRSLGADLVCFIGSDQWVHPSYFAGLEGLEAIRTGAGFAVVDELGTRIAHLWLPYVSGCGPKIIPRALLEPSGFRPCEDDRMKSLDASLMRGLGRDPEDQAGLEWRDHADVVSLRYVDFKSRDAQIHPFRNLARRHARYIGRDPWAALAEHYSAELVETMAEVYRARRAAR